MIVRYAVTFEFDTQPPITHRGTMRREQRTKVTADRVLQDIDTAANLDIAEAFDAQQRLKSIHDMPLHLRRCITSIEVVKRNVAAGDGTQEYVHKVKFIDKGKMHELLTRHVGLFEGPMDDRPPVPAFVLTDTTGVRVQ